MKKSDKRYKKKKNGKKRKRFSWKLFSFFIFYELIFMTITSPIIIFYGPFDNVKRTMVGTSMATFKNQWIAKTFMSENKINDLLGKNKSKTVEQNLKEVKIEHKGDLKIIRRDIEDKKFNGYLLEISDPTKVKVGYTKNLKKEGQRTSEMAEDKGAIAAINGGGFSDISPDGKLYAGNGAFPSGFVISEGKEIYKDISNDTRANVIAFDKEGRLIVGDHSINSLKEAGAVEAISFRPPTLIVNGEGQVEGDGGEGLNPRTAIGQRIDGTILLLVIDGRDALKLKPGASLKDVEQILLKYGAVNAANLDGGSSSTMYYDGEVINSPSNWAGERSVATCIYVLP